MSEIVVTGGSIGGMLTALLLEGDGHHVTILERDPAPPPTPEQAWDDWERRGVNQFRLLHFFQPRFRTLLEEHLPDVSASLHRAGALEYSFIANIPEGVRGPLRDDDARFTALTARRPVAEAAIAAAVAERDGIVLRRGVAVAGLLSHANGERPQVVGVRSQDGEELRADLVVDAAGRRSPLPGWLTDIGAPAPIEELEDSGFVYYGRHLRSADGSLPPMLGPPLQHFDTFSVLTLPCDRGTWGTGIIASSSDKTMRATRDVEVWERVIRSCPLLAHWLDAEPMQDDVTVMAKMEDRIRHFEVDGEPVAAGVVAVADSWACTNPSLGRGATIGLMHAITLSDVARDVGVADADAFVRAFAASTRENVEPWYRSTLWIDRHRLGEIDAALDGRPYETDNDEWFDFKAFQANAASDPEMLRLMLTSIAMYEPREDVMARPDVGARIREWRELEQVPPLGPTRSELLELVA